MKIPINPNQQVELIPEFADLIIHPPDKDIAIRTLSQKLANTNPLIQGDLVIAGKNTLNDFPLANEYPVHFRKTYYPASFHPPATQEYEKHNSIAPVINLPPAIGATTNCFRSCFISGKSLADLSPFGVEPEGTNLLIAKKPKTASLIGLWTLLGSLYRQIKKLHSDGFVHGDLFLHNVIVSTSPIDLYLIDFALARQRDKTDDDQEWAQRCENDLSEVFRHALWVQSGLGMQMDDLGDASLKRAPDLLPASHSSCLDKIQIHSLLQDV